LKVSVLACRENRLRRRIGGTVLEENASISKMQAGAFGAAFLFSARRLALEKRIPASPLLESHPRAGGQTQTSNGADFMHTAKLLLYVLVGQTTGALREPAVLVEKLGAETEARREAVAKLESLGSQALPALRAALKSRDPAIRSRASALLQTIEGNILLQGTKVRLDFQHATAAAVLESLNNQTGSELELGHQKPNSVGPRITLRDPEPVSFWKAIDRFCEAAGLVCDDHFVALPAPPVAGWGLVFSYQPDRAKVPSYDHGAFRIKVLMLFYHNELSYIPGLQADHRMKTTALGVSPDGKLDGEELRNPRAHQEPLPGDAKQARRQGRPEEPNNGLDRTVRFRVELQIVPDSRMEISFNGPPELHEAVDELDNSLLPTSRSEGNGYTPPMRAMMGGFGGRSDGPASVFLHRPQKPGKLIKKLRGTLNISIVARWPEPVVIPVTNAAGKLLETDEMRVVVKSIETDANGKPSAIELMIKELDTRAPEEQSIDYPPGSPFSRHWRLLAGGIGAHSPLSRIEVVDARGQDTFSQFQGSQQGSGPVTLRLTPSPRSGESKEIRLWSIVRTTAKIPFEFEHLPMP
jgi:hypothetical protein